MTITHDRPSTHRPSTLDVGSDGIARLRLNRPEASNGLNVELLKALHEAILRCHCRSWVRVVLLSGEGRNFCAGGDIHTFESKGAELPQYLREATAWLQLATSALIQLRVPVVDRGSGFRRRRGRAGAGLRFRHRRRSRVGEILLRGGAGRNGPRWRVIRDADPARRTAPGAASAAAQPDAVPRRRRWTSAWSPRLCPTMNYRSAHKEIATTLASSPTLAAVRHQTAGMERSRRLG